MKYVCPKCSETKKEHRKERNVMCPKCETIRMLLKPGGEEKCETISFKPGSESTDIENSDQGEENKVKWICTICYEKKKKDPSITETKCPRCKNPMELERDANVIYRKRSSSSMSHKNKGKDKSKKEEYVYVLVSSEKPGIVKIGVTERSPEKRAEEISSSTGVAMPYIVAYKTKTAHAERVEKAVHERLSDKRVNPNREFFKVKTARAIEIIEEEK